MTPPSIGRGLWWSGSLIATGLLVDLGVAWWNHPLAFVAFLMIACPLVLAGTLVFLWTLVATQS
jgi:hypothetical protein